MYGNDLSSRSRTLNGGRWRLTRFCSRCSASTSVRGDDHLDVGDALDELRDRRRACRRARLEVRAHARAQRLRLARRRARRRARRGRGRRPASPGAPFSCLANVCHRRLAYPGRDTGLSGQLSSRSALALAPAAHAGGAVDRARRGRGRRRAPTRRVARRDEPAAARAASAPCGSRRTGSPGDRAADRARAARARERRAAAARRTASASTSRSTTPGSRTTPLTPEAQAEFAAYTAADRAPRTELPRRDRRQRAEPQPLLAAAVQRRRHRTPPRPPTWRCSRRPTTR